MQGQPNKMQNSRYLLVAAMLATAVLYSKLLFYGHISWDDPEMVFKNKDVQDFDVAKLISRHYVGNYIPVTMFLHTLNWFVFGAAEWGHHIICVMLHLVNGLLIFFVGQKLFRSERTASIGVIVFLLHPLQVESVAWIAELKNVLSTLFYLSSLLCYISYTETEKKTSYFSALMLFVFGCLSKSSVVVLPLIFIAFDAFMLKTVSVRLFFNKIPFLLLSVLFGFVNIKTQTADMFINHSHEFVWYQRTGLAGFALVKYLLLFIFPVNLSVIYPYPTIKTTSLIVGFCAWAVIVAILIVLLKNKVKKNAFTIAFILLNLSLVLQFIPFGEVLYADRYGYLPVAGFAWLLAFGFEKIKLTGRTAGTGLIGVLGLITFFRVGAWKSAICLYEDILKKYPGQFVALNSAGVESMFLNNNAKALEYLNEATKVAPKNYKGFYNRGLLFIKNNRPAAAIKSFNQALVLYEYPKAYVGRATAYYMLSDLPKAINDANHVLFADQGNAKAHFILGNCYSELNRLYEALIEYNKCIELNGEEADYYFKRGIVYGKRQDFEQSLSDFEICLSLRSNFYEAHFWKGVAKLNLKQNPCADFRIAAQNNYSPAIKAFNKYCR